MHGSQAPVSPAAGRQEGDSKDTPDQRALPEQCQPEPSWGTAWKPPWLASHHRVLVCRDLTTWAHAAAKTCARTRRRACGKRAPLAGTVGKLTVNQSPRWEPWRGRRGPQALSCSRPELGLLGQGRVAGPQVGTAGLRAHGLLSREKANCPAVQATLASGSSDTLGMVTTTSSGPPGAAGQATSGVNPAPGTCPVLRSPAAVPRRYRSTHRDAEAVLPAAVAEPTMSGQHFSALPFPRERRGGWNRRLRQAGPWPGQPGSRDLGTWARALLHLPRHSRGFQPARSAALTCLGCPRAPGCLPRRTGGLKGGPGARLSNWCRRPGRPGPSVSAGLSPRPLGPRTGPA